MEIFSSSFGLITGVNDNVKTKYISSGRDMTFSCLIDSFSAFFSKY